MRRRCFSGLEKSRTTPMNPVKKITLHAEKVFIRMSNKVCAIFGHRWLYKDYSNYIQADGSKYAFKASRSCTRCSEHAYFYSAWVSETKSKTDHQGDYFGVREIEINKVVYS